MSPKRLYVGIACLFLAGPAGTAETTTVREVGEGERMVIEVSNDWYRLHLAPDRAGRISSLVPAGSQTELTFLGYGIGSVTRTDLGVGGGFDIPLKHTVRKLPSGLEVVLSSGVENRELLGGLEYTKTYVFREDTPFIQLKTEVTNHGAGSIVAWRLYNDIAVSRDLKAVVFQEGARAGGITGPAAWSENNPALAKAWKIWDRAGSGWGGVSTGLGHAVIFRSDPGAVHEVLTFANEEYGAYELRFRDALDRGQSVVRSVYLAVVGTEDGRVAVEKLRSQPGVLAGMETTLAQESAVRTSDTVRVGAESDRLLVVGNPYRYGFYRTHLAAELPEFVGKADFAALDYATLQKTVYGFPVSAAGMSRYRLVVFVDTPHFYLPASAWKLVEGFVRAGGTAVFVGDHAIGYEGTEIEKLLPARFDYTALTDSVSHKVMNDRAPYVPLEPGATADPLVRGLDWSAPPPVSVHKSVARARAEVLLKAGRWPVLTRWHVDQGTVYSFPVCLTANYHIPYNVDEPEYEGSETIPIKAEPPGERAKSLFLWTGYDDLWRSLAAGAFYGDKAPAVTRLQWQRAGDGSRAEAAFEAVNLPPKAVAEVSVHAGDGPERHAPVRIERGHGVVTLSGFSLFDELSYRLTITAGGREVLRRTGRIPVPTPPPFTLTVGDWEGLCHVFRRGYRVPFRVDCREAGATVEVKLVDPWGKVVWEKQVAAAEGLVKDALPLEGMAYGDYRLVAEAGGFRQVEQIHLRPDLAEEDAFFVTSHGDASCGGTDDPQEQRRLIRRARDSGLNMLKSTDSWRLDLLRWPARSRRARGDLILLEGVQPSHSDEMFIGGWGSPAHLSDEELHAKVRRSLTTLDNAWGMAPAGLRTYTYDEPGHGGAGATETMCPKCLETYRQTYGESVPKDRNDTTYYRYIRIAEGEMMRAYEGLARVWHELDTNRVMRPYGVTNEGSGLQEHPLALSRALGTYGMDLFSLSPGNWKAQYACEMAMAACDWDPHNLMYNVEAGSFYGGTPTAAQRGQGAYSVLARGARLLTWYDWEITELQSRLGIMPERFAAVRRASLEALKIGPLLAGMKRPRGKLAMLVPSAVQHVGTGQARRDNDDVLAQAYRAAQVSCGVVDFLYYQHLREGKLQDYPLLLLAGNDWIDTEMLPIIENWVRNGGTLIVMPHSGLRGEDLKPTELYTRICPLTWGDRCDGAGLADTQIKTGMAWKIKAEGGRQLYTYENGSSAAVQYDLDKGRVAVFGFVPGDAFGMEAVFAGLGLDPSVTRSSDPEAAAWLLGTGAARYVVAINSENRAKTVEFSLALEPKLQAFDMLSGKRLPLSRDARGRLLLKLDLEPFWGRAVALLPRAPAKLALKLPSRAMAGTVVTSQLRLLNATGGAVAGCVPVEITVHDARGQARPEYGGRLILRDGVRELRLDLGVNDPPGQWRMEAREVWTGIRHTGEWRVTAGRKP